MQPYTVEEIEWLSAPPRSRTGDAKRADLPAPLDDTDELPQPIAAPQR